MPGQADAVGTMTLDISDFEKKVNELVTKHLKRIEEATANTSKSISTLGELGKSLGVNLGKAGVAAFVADLLSADRAATEFGKSLDSIDSGTAGFAHNLTKGGEAMVVGKSLAADYVSALEKIPIVGGLMASIPNAMMAGAKLVHQASMDMQREAIGTQGVLAKLHALEKDRAALNRWTIGGATTSVLTLGFSTHKKNEAIKDIDEVKSLLAGTYTDLIRRETEAENVSIAGSIKKQRFAQIELEKQAKIQKLAEDTKNEFGNRPEEGSRVYHEGLVQINKAAEAQRGIAQRAADIAQVNVQAATKVAQTELDGVIGRRNAAAYELDQANKVAEITKGAGEEAEGQANAARDAAIAKSQLAERDLSMARIGTQLSQDTLRARQAGVAEEIKIADAQIKAATAQRDQFKPNTVEFQQADIEVQLNKVAKRQAEIAYAGIRELQTKLAGISFELAPDAVKNQERLTAEGAKLADEYAELQKHAELFGGDQEKALQLSIAQNAEAQRLATYQVAEMTAQNIVNEVAAHRTPQMQSELDLMRAQIAANEQLISQARQLNLIDRVKQLEAENRNILLQRDEMIFNQSLQARQEYDTLLAMRAEMSGHRELAAVLKTQLDYDRAIAQERRAGHTDRMNALREEKDAALNAALAELDFRTPAQKHADYVANLKTRRHNRAEQKRNAEPGENDLNFPGFEDLSRPHHKIKSSVTAPDVKPAEKKEGTEHPIQPGAAPVAQTPELASPVAAPKAVAAPVAKPEEVQAPRFVSRPELGPSVPAPQLPNQGPEPYQGETKQARHPVYVGDKYAVKETEEKPTAKPAGKPSEVARFPSPDYWQNHVTHPAPLVVRPQLGLPTPKPSEYHAPAATPVAASPAAAPASQSLSAMTVQNLVVSVIKGK